MLLVEAEGADYHYFFSPPHSALAWYDTTGDSLLRSQHQESTGSA